MSNIIKSFLFVLLTANVFFVDSAFAINSIYIFKPVENYGIQAKEEMCIVVNPNEWNCTINVTNTTISGHSKTFPMSFDFQIGSLSHAAGNYSQQTVMMVAENFLHNYARVTSTVFSSISIRDDGNGDYIINGAYFDNNYLGHFSLYIQRIGFDANRQLKKVCYIMFVKLKENINPYKLNDEMRENLYQKALELITPIYQLNNIN
jgi:hypothetical protein